MIFSINNVTPVINIGHINPNIGRHYRVNIVFSNSKSNMMLTIYIRIGQYLEPCMGFCTN